MKPSRASDSDQELVLAIERARGRNRAGTNKRHGWERELWNAYLLDGPGRVRSVTARPSEQA